MGRHPSGVHVLDEAVGSPSVPTVQIYKTELANSVSIVSYVSFPARFGIIPVNSYQLVVMGDGEGQDLAIQFLLAAYEPEELDGSPDSNNHAVGILAICDVQRRGSALHLACQEGEVYQVRRHKIGLIARDKVADKR